MSEPTIEADLRAHAHLASQIATLHDVTRWITALHGAYSQRRPWTKDATDLWFRSTFEQFEATLQPAPSVTALFERTMVAVQALEGEPLPLVPHIELGPDRLRYADYGLIALDTSGNEMSDACPAGGLPVGDLHHFATCWLRIVDGDGGGRLRAVPDIDLGESGSRPLAAANTMASFYRRRLDIHDGFVAPLVIRHWAELALRQAGAEHHGDHPVSADAVAMIDRLAGSGLLVFDHGHPQRPHRRRSVGFVTPFSIRDGAGHGAPKAIAGMVAAVGHSHDVSVLSTVAPETPPALAHGNRIEEIPRPSEQGSAPRLRRLWALLKGRSAWSSDWRSPSFERRLHDLVDESEVVHVEFVVLADALPAAVPSTTAVVVTDHDPPIRGAVDRLHDGPWWWRPYRYLEVLAWRRTYRRAARQADVFVVFNPIDRERIRPNIGSTPIAVVPFPIAVPTQALEPPAPTVAPRIGFVGSYQHPPNVAAADRLAHRIMPLIWASAPEVELRLIGPRPPSSAVEADARIVATGFVDDIATELSDIVLLAAPLEIGGGMRVKVLEALSAGRVVVGSPPAAAGLPPELRRWIVVADSDEDFAQAVLDVLADPEARDRRAEGGREAAAAWLAPERAADRYDELYVLVEALRGERHRQ